MSWMSCKLNQVLIYFQFLFLCFSFSDPYYNNQTALGATHCFVDGKSCTLAEEDAIALKQAGVQVLTINFINAFLNNENVNPDTFSASFKSSS